VTDDLPVFTIGHSTRTIPEFVELLRAGAVRTVVDVRTVPRSRTNPQYNFDLLPDTLGSHQIGYRRIAELGGLRSKSELPAEVNGLWRNQSFHNYADYALTTEFAAGLSDLIEIASTSRTAIMCAEAVWWRCHRRIVADHLIARGRQVFHLMASNSIQPAQMTDGSVIRETGVLYPRPGPKP
jgi:uncharacterized protein (DUF488 family)